jgi:hypothetical protein
MLVMSRSLEITFAFIVPLTIVSLCYQSSAGRGIAVFRANKSSSTGLLDISSDTVRKELRKRGVDATSTATLTGLKDALVQYDFQVGNGNNLNSNSEEVVKAIKDLNASLFQTSLQCHIKIRTKSAGARIWYRLIGRDDAHQFNQLTNGTEDDIPIGIYSIWSERHDTPTSSKTAVFRIIQVKTVVDLEELGQ